MRQSIVLHTEDSVSTHPHVILTMFELLHIKKLGCELRSWLSMYGFESAKICTHIWNFIGALEMCSLELGVCPRSHHRTLHQLVWWIEYYCLGESNLNKYLTSFTMHNTYALAGGLNPRPCYLEAVGESLRSPG